MLQEPQSTSVPYKSSGDGNFELLRQIRGLNHSFAESLRKKLEKDPALELTSLFTQYQSHLDGIHRNFGQKASKEFPKVGAASGPLLDTTSSHQQPQMSVPWEKPTPPPFQATAFSFGDNKQNNSVTAMPTLTFGSNVEGKEPIKPAFTFGASALAQSGEDFVPKTEIKLLNFGQKLAADPTKTSQPESFGVSKPFEPPKPSEVSKPFEPPKPFELPKPFEPPKSFEPPKPFSFGQTATTPAFSFGTPAAGGEKPTPAPSGVSLHFSFSSPPPTFGGINNTAANTKMAEEENEDDDGIPEGEEESFSGGRSNTDLIRTGAGEEDETTVVDQRCKLFVFEKERGWTDLGVALFKVNQRKDDADKSRMLARAEGSGKILLNAWINVAVQVDHLAGKKEFTLLCTNQDAKLAQYLVRCKETTQAQELAGRISSLKPTKPTE